MSESVTLSRRIRNALSYRLSTVERLVAWYRADAYFVSFPKSGRTWVRTFLAKYLSLHFDTPYDDRFNRITRSAAGFPLLYFTHRGPFGDVVGRDERGFDNPIYDTAAMERNIRALRGKRVAMMSRDPRDVIISHYFALRKRKNYPGLREAIEEMGLKGFIRHEQFGIPYIVTYMNMWARQRDSFKDFFLLRYEDCRQQPEEPFRDLLAFFGVEKIDEEAFAQAIDFSSFDNMRSLEQSKALHHMRLQPTDEKDAESYKTRKGKVGGFVEHFDADDIAFAQETLNHLDPLFGYSS